MVTRDARSAAVAGAVVRSIDTMATKHMNAAPGDFAETVLMPGDPLRAQFIAENWLSGARRVPDVRHMGGYTGEYEGIPGSVMADGMGLPSGAVRCSER